MSYNDFAIILTWPDATIRGDEKWMMFFKKIGIVKNLNFKVGHTGIIVVNHRDGEMLFYDFGRYITPRGYGRARSEFSDPRLHIGIRAKVKDGQIQNVEEIVEHLESLKGAMYGEGKLYFSITHGINFDEAKTYGDAWVMKGTYPYGAVARNNNNCSRFITRMLIQASARYHFWHPINFPETIKASPISNVVNSASDRMIYSYTQEEGLRNFKMNRWQSFGFLLQKLGDNVLRKRAVLLPNDLIIGAMDFRSKPISIPKDAVYLGGVGDGAWYAMSARGDKKFIVKRFTTVGELEYVVLGEATEDFQISVPYQVTYDSHLLFTHIVQDGRKIKIEHLKQLENTDYAYEHIKERYA